jgi:hypothetical protein
MSWIKLYHSICQKSMHKLEDWRDRTNEMHRHHIIPKHAGGLDLESNYTYLTIREHIIAHFLLWKIHRNPNDLRAMYMLGAKLTRSQRKLIGEWCRDNNIGFHTPENRLKGAIASMKVQKLDYEENGNKNWYYWSTDEGRKERATLGGNASWEVQKQSRNGLPFFLSLDPEERIERAKHANSHSPKKQVTDGVVTYKLHTEDDVDAFIKENTSFRRGCHYSSFPKTKDMICVNKDGINKMIKKEDESNYIERGWLRGKIMKDKDKKIAINKDNILKFVVEKELNFYLQFGWIVGGKKKISASSSF